MTIIPAINQCAIKHNEKFYVAKILGEHKYQLVESAASRYGAERAAKILQDHSDKNGLQYKYTVLPTIDTISKMIDTLE
ncbi:MAG: hypothetical protein AAB456_02375 [Patescibacteria group bacterium]